MEAQFLVPTDQMTQMLNKIMTRVVATSVVWDETRVTMRFGLILLSFCCVQFPSLILFFLTRDRLRVDIKRFPVSLPFVCSEIREKKEEKVESRQD